MIESTHTLIVCTSCNASFDCDAATETAEGNRLFLQLQTAHRNSLTQDKLKIQATGCLWTCDRPCSVSIVCPNKYTYHFADVPDQNSAEDLLKVCQLFIESEDGYILPAKLPRSLRSKLLVRIPPPEQSLQNSV